jgi:hypothetical protein
MVWIASCAVAREYASSLSDGGSFADESFCALTTIIRSEKVVYFPWSLTSDLAWSYIWRNLENVSRENAFSTTSDVEGGILRELEQIKADDLAETRCWVLGVGVLRRALGERAVCVRSLVALVFLNKALSEGLL